jgi:hydroxymethylglutaryl-CoA reductase
VSERSHPSEWQGGLPLPPNFRKLSFSERRTLLGELASRSGKEEAQFDDDFLGLKRPDIADSLVESAIGYLPVPFGVASGFIIDGRAVSVPMAVEEPSVIAAATYAARLVAGEGGFTTWATPPEMVAHVYIEGARPEGASAVLAGRGELGRRLEPQLESMRARGGGLRAIGVDQLAELGLLRVSITIDVRDAMGANLLNTAAESLAPLLEELTGGTAIMKILTNEASGRRAGASLAIPVDRLRRGALSGSESARRIVLASEIARVDPSRAVTHNKGVMNGISALALATGNDTRGIEAAVHRYASRDGVYRGVTRFELAGGMLQGRIEIPLPMAATGGSVGFQAATAFALELLGHPDGPTLSRIAAAVGLGQNFAALFALVTDGIQKGHMRLHAARLALQAGAAGDEIREVARMISESGRFTREEAVRILSQAHGRQGAGE